MKAIHLTKENFDAEARRSPEPILVDFYADWCGPCKMLAPTVEELAAEADGYRVGKLNVDEAPEIAEEFGVMSIPTVIVLKGGAGAARAVGGRPQAALLDLLN